MTTIRKKKNLDDILTYGNDAGGNKIANVGAPTTSGDAVRKDETDALDTRVTQNESDISDKLDKSGGTMTGDLVLNGNPDSALKAATKQYVDAALQGGKIKEEVVAATTADITLSGEQTIDGISIVDGDRVLVMDQTAQEENGIYVASTGSWSRSSDADSWSELVAALVIVKQGSTNGDTLQLCTVDSGGTLGTTAVTWSQIGTITSYTADGEGIEVSGTVFSLELDGSTLSKSSSGLKVAGISSSPVGESETQTLTNKTIDADDNTITNIGATEIKSEMITGQTTKWTPASGDYVLITDGAASNAFKKVDATSFGGGGGGSVVNSTADGRLTLSSGNPVMTTDVTAATTLYYTPYLGNSIAVYDGTSSWSTLEFSEVSLSLSGYTADTNYDIWGYDDSGSLALESTAWTNNTTRATALVYQDGVLVKSGATTRRYLGTIRITGTTGQCEFSFGSRAGGGGASRLYVWNMNNRVDVASRVSDSTSSWSYTTASWRSANNSTGNRVSFISGVACDSFSTSYYSVQLARSNGSFSGISLDSTSSLTGTVGMVGTLDATAAGFTTASSNLCQVTPLGFHFVQAIENGNGSAVSTYYGDDGSTLRSGLFFNFKM